MNNQTSSTNMTVSYVLKLSTFLISTLLFLNSQQTTAQCNSIIDVDFNNWEDGRYTIDDAKKDFNNKVKPWTAAKYRGIEGPGAANKLIQDTPQETRIANKTLRAQYLKNSAGGVNGGFLFDSYFDGVEEAYLEYRVKFDKNFIWATGGKLPGLGGSTQGIGKEDKSNGVIPSGRRYKDDTGFSARLMWRRNRAHTTKPKFILYSYFAKDDEGKNRKDNQNGDEYNLLSGLKSNQWYTIKQYIKLNSPGKDDGTVKMWIDGKQFMNNNKMNIRQKNRSDLKINALIMHTYRGGAKDDKVWWSKNTEYAFFDDFKVWTGCSDAPDGGTGSTNNTNKINSVNKPGSVKQGQTVAINVKYDVSAKRDIVVRFEKDTKPFELFREVRASVNAGSGTKTINVKIPSDTPVANNEYQFQTFITPTGKGWKDRLDNENNANVNVTKGGSAISGTFYFKNRASGQYMDSEGDSNKSSIVNGKHKWADQHWKVVEVSNGNYNIIGVHGDRGCLDSQGGGQVIWSSVQSSSSKDRLWKLEDAGNGYYRFKNQFDNRGYLAKANNSNKIEYTDWNGNRAQWKLEKVSSAKELSPELATNTVKIYPNPATSFFTIDTGNDVASTLQVFNISGQMVLERVVSNVTTVPTDALGAGIYFVRVFNEDGSDSYTEKLILK